MAGTERVGVALHERSVPEQLAAIELADRLGVASVWLTTGGVNPDSLTLFAAAASRTSRITFGTAIIPTFPRHPLVVVEQAVVVAALAPGRLRIGVGPSHRPTIEGMFGLPMDRPLEHLAEYVTVLKAALQQGRFDFDGERFHVRGELADPPNVPVLMSALRPASYRVAGRVADGALAWLCPLPYLRQRALPALRQGAAEVGRAAPPLIAHCFVALGGDAAAVRAAAQERLAGYARLPFYQQMFAQAGFPEALEGRLSDGMLDAVVMHGDETAVADRLRAYLAAGLGLTASTLIVGPDRRAELERILRLVAAL